jgi:hypothetical protein
MNNKDRTARLRKTIKEQRDQIDTLVVGMDLISERAAEFERLLHFCRSVFVEEEKLKRSLNGVLVSKKFESISSDELLDRVRILLEGHTTLRAAYDEAALRESPMWDQMMVKNMWDQLVKKEVE